MVHLPVDRIYLGESTGEKLSGYSEGLFSKLVIEDNALIAPHCLTVQLQSACWLGDLNAMGQGLMTSPFKKMKKGRAKIKYLKLLEKLRTNWEQLKRRNLVVLLPELLHAEINNDIIILECNNNNKRIIKK